MTEEDAITKVTDDTFELEVTRCGQPVLVDFWAEWCGPCRAMAPTLDALAARYRGRLKVVKVDVDRNPVLSRQYGIRAIPTLLLVRAGEVKATLVGAQSRRQLEGAIDEHLGAAGSPSRGR